MEIVIYILYSINKNFKINNYYKIKLNKKVGEGSYGIVYEINNNLVVKIFKNSTNLIKDKDYNDINLIPEKNENREINFFLDYLKSNYINNDYIIKISSIAIIKHNNFDNKKLNNKYLLILPYCAPLSNLFNKWHMPLIKNISGKQIILNLMKRLIEIEIFLNNKFNIINMDIKLNNYMIEKYKNIDINNIIALDFGLTLKKSNINYNINNDYFIWPYGNNIKIDIIPSYSICINALILYLGLKNLKKKSIITNLNYIKNDIDFYDIFFSGLFLKINIIELKNLIDKYIKKYNIKH